MCGSAIDGRTTRHAGYAVSQRKRKRIEECFGWLKTVALMRKVRHRGVCKVDWIFTFACAAYNLVRMRNLAAEFRRLKSGPKCVRQSLQLEFGTAKTPKIRSLDMAKDEKKHATNQFFRSLLGFRNAPCSWFRKRAAPSEQRRGCNIGAQTGILA
jgi:hypothetical protein